MVDNQHWLDRWSQNRIGFHEADVNRHLRGFLPRFALPAGARVFVPLCGKAHDLAWLAAQGYRVVGVELSRIAIEAFFDEQGIAFDVVERGAFVEFQGPGLSLLHGDFYDLSAADLEDCALVYDRASLIAMEKSDRPRYFRHMREIAAAIPEMLLITLDYDQVEMSGPPFAVADDEVHRHYGDTYDVEQLLRDDVLDESPRWRKVGLTALGESVFRLRRLGQG